MSISIVCPHCGNPGRAPAESSGRAVRCSRCRGKLRVPLPLGIVATPPALPSPDVELVRVDAPRVQGGESVLSLGVGSLVLGLVGLAIGFMPCLGFVGLLLSVPGMILGMLGLVISFDNKGRSIGFPLAGAILSACAVALGVFWYLLPYILADQLTR